MNYSKLSRYSLFLAKTYSFITLIFLFVDFILLLSNKPIGNDKLYQWLFIYLIGNLPFISTILLIYLFDCYNPYDQKTKNVFYHFHCLTQFCFHISGMIVGMFNEYTNLELYIYICFTIGISFLFLFLWILLPIYVYFSTFYILDEQLSEFNNNV